LAGLGRDDELKNRRCSSETFEVFLQDAMLEVP
jgi:hypothetical protein